MKSIRKKKFSNIYFQTKRVALVFYHFAIIGLMLEYHLCVAAEWEVDPTIQAVVNYTDNVALAATDTKQADVIGEILPGLVIKGDGVHTNILLDYQMQAVYYEENKELNNIFHQLDLELNQNLIDDNLYLDAIGIYEQQVLDNRDTAPPSNIFVSTNRTNTASFQVSPYFYKAFRDDIRFLIRPSYGEVKYEDLSQFNNTISQGATILEQIPSKDSFGWRISAQKRLIEYKNGDEIDLQRIDYGIAIPITMRGSWFINGGREINDFKLEDTAENIEDTLWLTGIRWEQGQRTYLFAAFGERFFGNTYDFEFKHRTRHSVWAIEYHEDLETQSLQMQPIMSTEEARRSYRQPRIGGIGRISNELYLTNRFVASINWRKSKSAIDLNIIDESREYRVSNREEAVIRGGVGYTLRFSSRTNLILNASYKKSEFIDLNRKDESGDYSFSLNRNISRKISAKLQYSHSNTNSSDDSFDNDYNLVSASIRATFE